MNKHKTFGYYLLELLKIICFGAALAWLVSCSNRKQDIINKIHAYEDSISVTELKYRLSVTAADSAMNAYAKAYPPTLFKRGDLRMSEWVAQENVAYKEYIKFKTDMHVAQVLLRARVKAYTKTIDSLKIELYK